MRLNKPSPSDQSNEKASCEKQEYINRQKIFSSLIEIDLKYKSVNPTLKEWEAIKERVATEPMSHQKLVSSLNRYRWYLNSRGQNHLLCGKKRSYR